MRDLEPRASILLAILLAIGGSELIFDLLDKDFRVGINILLTLFAGGALLAVALLADLVVQVTRTETTVDPAAIRFSKDLLVCWRSSLDLAITSPRVPIPFRLRASA